MKNNGMRSSRQSRIAGCALALALLAGMAWGYGPKPNEKLVYSLRDHVEFWAHRFHKAGWYSVLGGNNSQWVEDGDWIRTDKTGRARVSIWTEATQTPVGYFWQCGEEGLCGHCVRYPIDILHFLMGPNTRMAVADIHPPESPASCQFKLDCGTLKSNLKKLFKGEPIYEIKTRRALAGPRGTEYLVQTGQKIAYVNGSDLWVMNDDGTGKTNYIAAPTGKKIGRSAFSPDGSQVVYEVWDCGGDRYPETSDLWIANGDGTNPHLLLGAGSLSDSTGKEPFRYRHRLLWGPSFSPDGTQVSCLRMQFYCRDDVTGDMLEQEVGTVPVSGGGFNSLWKTIENLGGRANADPTYFERNWPQFAGMNTAWSPEGEIAFRRSARQWLTYSYGITTFPTNQTSWPFEIMLGSAHETDYAPQTMQATLDGETINLLPHFKGYGFQGWNNSICSFYEHPTEDWYSQKAEAVYGKVSRNLAEGPHTLELYARTDVAELRRQTNFTVAKGETLAWNGSSTSWVGGTSQGSGVWTIPSAGGEPTRWINRYAASVAWSQDGTLLAASLSGNPNVWSPITIGVYDADGQNTGTFSIESDNEAYIGNWNVSDQRLVYWSGTDGVGTLKSLEVSSGDVTDLGPGEFPTFASLYYTIVSVSEGTVAVTDTNGQHEVLCSAGQTVSVDDLQNDGWPQAAVAVREPIVTNVIPAWGSVVPNDTNLTVRFQFNVPVATNTLPGCELTGVSWPEQTNDGMADLALQMQYWNQTNNPARCFHAAVSNLASQGVGVGHWNGEHTEFAVTVTNAAFSRTNGNACEISLGLDGVATTNGEAFAFNDASTRFRFVDSVGSAGGNIGGGSGERLIVPPDAVTQSVAFSSSVAKHPPAGGDSPTNTGWRQIGGFYTFGPAGQSLSSNVTICLPVDNAYPGVAIWYFDGANWTNVGGTFDPTNGQVSVALGHLGSFCAFYQPPAGAWLQAIKTADVSSATNGQTVQFVLTVDNLGTETASNVLVVDALPAGLDCVTTNIGAGGTYDAETRTVAWTPGDLAGGSNHVAWFSAMIATSATYGAAITNVTVVDSDQTVATNSNASVVTVGLPAGAANVFGAGGMALTDWSNRVALGGGFVRAAAQITTVQAQNTNFINFAPFDAAVTNAQARGLGVYGIVDAASVGGVWPAAADFARAFGLYVERYDGDGFHDMPGLAWPVRHWEVFNEFQYDASKWAGCTLAMYADYLSTAHATAHTADPATTILSGSFPGFYGYTNYFEPLLTNYPWVASAIDAVSYHDYWESTWYWTGTNWTAQYLEAATLRDTLARLGLSAREVWAVETDFGSTYDYWKSSYGYTATQLDNALLLARAYPYALAAGIDHLIYTEFNYQSFFPERLNWTVMTDSSGNRRMNFYVFQKMIEKLEGFTEATLLDLGNADMGVKFLNASNQPVWVLWNWSNATRQVELQVGPVSQVRITPCLPATFNNTGATWLATTNELTNGAGYISVDGAPKYIEAVGWVDPDIDGDGIPNELDPDMDGDGMPNTFELAHELDEFANDATADADEDGMLNGDEYRAGTDPQQATSILECASPAPNGSVTGVEWASVSGKTYKVGWNPNLAGAWSNAADGLIQATNSRTTWYDSGPPKTAPLTNSMPRFYRVGVLP